METNLTELPFALFIFVISSILLCIAIKYRQKWKSLPFFLLAAAMPIFFITSNKIFMFWGFSILVLIAFFVYDFWKNKLLFKNTFLYFLYSLIVFLCGGILLGENASSLTFRFLSVFYIFFLFYFFKFLFIKLEKNFNKKTKSKIILTIKNKKFIKPFKLIKTLRLIKILLISYLIYHFYDGFFMPVITAILGQ